MSRGLISYSHDWLGSLAQTFDSNVVVTDHRVLFWCGSAMPYNKMSTIRNAYKAKCQKLETKTTTEYLRRIIAIYEMKDKASKLNRKFCRTFEPLRPYQHLLVKIHFQILGLESVMFKNCVIVQAFCGWNLLVVLTTETHCAACCNVFQLVSQSFRRTLGCSLSLVLILLWLLKEKMPLFYPFHILAILEVGNVPTNQFLATHKLPQTLSKEGTKH